MELFHEAERHGLLRYSADASTTRVYGGLGLGLSIVKNLVELHGGTITAASDMESTRFTIELPCIASPSGTG